MLNKLTHQEVSKEMVDVLSRLSKNESVPYDEIKNLKEVKVAYACINNSIQTSNLKNREELQKGIIDEIEKRGSIKHESNGNVSFTGEIKRERRIDIVIGLPAAGKSSTLVEPLSEEFKSRVVDSDEIKKMIPEFNDGWGAGVVHEESKIINGQVLIDSLLKGENIVFPIVGSDYESLLKKVEICNKMDYKVYVHYNELPVNKAIGRVLNRYLEERRFVDPKILYNYGNSVEQVYEAIKTKGEMINGYSKFCNDVKRGEKPKLIETNCDGKLWRDQRNQQAENHDYNTGNARGQRELSNKSNGESITGIRSTEKEVRKQIVAAGYKPNKTLVGNLLKLDKLCNKEIKIGNVKSLLKGEKSPEIKELARSVLDECKRQDRIMGLER